MAVVGLGVALNGVPALAHPCAPLKKRAAVHVAQPIVVGQVRYEAPADGKAHGLGQNGGYIVAHDATSGAQLWVLKVFAIDYAANMEADKQDVFITDMKASPDAAALLLTDERGRRWRVDLRTRTSAPD
jgi:hypothetical protein